MKREILHMEIRSLIPLFIIIGVAGIVGSFTTQVQSDVADDFVAGSAEANISASAMEGNQNLAARMGTIGLIAGIVIVLVLLVRGLGGLGGI